MRIQSLRAFPALLLVVLLGAASTARADFEVEFIIDNVVQGGGPFVTNGNSLSLVHTFGSVTFQGAATSNGATVTTQGTINISSTIRNADSVAHDIMIIASDNRYLTPIGLNFAMQSTASGQFLNSDENDTQDYTGSFVKGSLPMVFGADVSNSVIHFRNIKANGGVAGLGQDNTQRTYPASGGTTSNNLAIVSTNPFGLTATLATHLEGADLTIGARQLITTASTVVHVRAVPEPGSLALLGFGMLGVAGYIRRRRHTNVPC